MKVLEKGNPNGWEIERTCTGDGNGAGGCGAKLLVAEADIYLTKAHHMGETDYYYTFKCPECGVETDVAECAVPLRIKNKLMAAENAKR